MELTRRDFLKVSGAATAGATVGTFGVDLSPIKAQAKTLRIAYAKESTTICPYCSVGCSAIVSVRDGKVLHIDGDPDSPINEGTLCPKGASIAQLSGNLNAHRLTKPRYRKAGGTEWEEVEWEWCIEEIAKRVKGARDKTFKTTNDQGQVVNRTDGIASVGSAAMDNEECYLYQKFLRSLGLVYIEHQARI
jgi:formate dehydrogenase major subunit